MVSLFIVTLGLVVGSLSGFAGGKTDSFIMGIVDILLALPGMIMALVIAGLLGLASVWWVRYARLIRGMTLLAKEKEFVESARAVGSGNIKDNNIPYFTAGASICPCACNPGSRLGNPGNYRIEFSWAGCSTSCAGMG